MSVITRSTGVASALALLGLMAWAQPATARITLATSKRLYESALRNSSAIRVVPITRNIPKITNRAAQRDWAEYRSAMARDPQIVKLTPRSWNGLSRTERDVIKGTFAILMRDTRNGPHLSIIKRKTGKVFLSGGPTPGFGLSWFHGPAMTGCR